MARTVGRTALGIAIMLVSTSLMNIGMVLQKRAVDGLPPLERQGPIAGVRAVVALPRWLAGWLMTVAALWLNMLALGMADLSIIQPLTGFGLVVLVLFSRFYLGERLTRPGAAGIAAAVAGVALLGAAAGPSRVFSGAEELVGSYLRGGALGSLAVLFAASALLGAGGLRLAPPAAGTLFSLAAAGVSVTGLTCAKGLFGVLALLGIGASAHMPAAWVLFGLVAVLSTGALGLQQLSFQKGPAVVVVPVFNVTSVVLPLGTGWALFGERLGPPSLAAVLLIAVGVLLLSRRPEPS